MDDFEELVRAGKSKDPCTIRCIRMGRGTERPPSVLTFRSDNVYVNVGVAEARRFRQLVAA